MSQSFDPDDYASEADYRAGRRDPHPEAESFDPDPTDDDRTSLRPISVTELLQRSTPKWLVRGLLLERALGVVFGASGSGKTFAVLDLAGSISRAVPWFGRRVRAGGVIIVAAEGHLKLRVEAYIVHHKLDVDTLRRLRIVPATVNLLRPESGDLDTLIMEIKHAAQEMEGVVLVVLDTLNSMMPGGNENASEDMGAMIAAARRIMIAVDCAVLYVHHCGKDETKGSRGHSSLKAAVDCELQVSGEGDRLLEATKVRDGESGQRFGFLLEAVDLGLAQDRDPEADRDERVRSCVVVPIAHAPAKAKPVRREVALDALREAVSVQGENMPESSTIPKGVKAVTIAQWKTRWLLRTGYEPGHSANVAFNQDKKRLIDADKIVISTPYVWIVR